MIIRTVKLIQEIKKLIRAVKVMRLFENNANWKSKRHSDTTRQKSWDMNVVI
jgi:hypothetical protein